jgi:hypothetical protein
LKLKNWQILSYLFEIININNIEQTLGSPSCLANIQFIEKIVTNKIPGPVQQTIQNFFKLIFNANKHLKLHADLSFDEGIKLFLVLLVRYESEKDLSKYF